jgi:formate C-acetyltransferase
MDRVAEAAHLSSVGRDRAAAETPGGHLQASLVVNDCIERCLGYTQGGARYNFCNWDIIGTANLADSLVAIRKLVYEERLLSLSELVAILNSDWDGQEFLRRQILNQFPHFGNGDGECDALMRRIITTLDAILKRRTPFRGGVYILGTTAGGENMHIEFGRVTSATPDGRRSGDPLADSIGAAQGRDREGVTALLNSVASLPHRLLPTATTLNVKLDPKLLQNDAGIDATTALIQSHFTSGGQQLQFTFVNREILLEAKAKPELYQNLMVRVAGYSAPFTSLWEDLQDEIIARTEHVAC